MVSSALSVTVVIPAYNESETIIPCLESCLNQDTLPREVIVVNNKSTDNTLKLVRDFKAKYDKSHRKPKGAARACEIIVLEQNDIQGLIPTRNAGLKMASGDIVGRIDADAILSPGWVKSLQEAFEDKSVQGATGPVTYYDMPLRRFSYKQDNAIRKLVQKRSNVVPMMFGTNMAMRKSAIDAIGREFCLDKEDVLHEDIDISIHFAIHNYKVIYVTDMVVGMSARRIEDNFKDFKAYQQRMITTFEKHDMNPTRGAKMSRVVFLILWFPLHAMRKPYLHRYNKIKKRYLDDLWKDGGNMSPFGRRAKIYLRKKFGKKFSKRS